MIHILQHYSKEKIEISHVFQIAIVVFHPTRLCILEFYYDFLQKYIRGGCFELMQMDKDLKKEDLKDKAKFMVTNEYDKRTRGLIQRRYPAARGIRQCSKIHYFENPYALKDTNKIKISSKEIIKLKK